MVDLVRVNGDYTVGVPLKLADGSTIAVPATIAISTAGVEAGAGSLAVNDRGELQVVQPDQLGTVTLDLTQKDAFVVDPAQFLAKSESTAFMEAVMASHEVFLPDITVSGSITVGLAAGPRKHTVTCTGAKVGDFFILRPKASMPAGYMLGDTVCLTDNQLEVSLYLPAVTLLANYSIGFGVCAVR